MLAKPTLPLLWLGLGLNERYFWRRPQAVWLIVVRDLVQLTSIIITAIIFSSVGT